MMAALSETEAHLPRTPFAPGHSPFRIKGVAYRGHLDYVRENVPGGEGAMIEELVRWTGVSDYERFFRQTFLASTRYDVYPLAMAGVACARLCGQTFGEFVRERTDHQARTDLNGVYRFLLKMVSPETIAARLPRLISQYYDFSWAETEISGPGLVTGRYRGVPAGLAAWMHHVCESYVETVLHVAGHANARVHTGEPMDDEPDEETGQPLVAVPFRVVL